VRFIIIGLAVCFSWPALAAVPLTQSTFTEIIRQVNVVAAATKIVTPARTNEIFKAPNFVRTGQDSRLEMTAPDQTVTRIGGNTVFTFEQGERSIRLFKGSVLFHPPAGVGGGTIRYGGTAAAVLGTTMICAVLWDGSFKIIVLEGEAKVTLSNGNSIQLKAGQMVIVPPDGKSFGLVEDVHLGQLVAHLLLVRGFSHPLSSMPLIEAAIQLQDEQITAGKVFHFVSLEVAGEGLELILDKIGVLNTSDQTTIFISPVR
jgi:FecR protein